MRESLRDLANIEYGASPKEIRSNDTTNIGIFGTGGCVGYSTKPLFKGPLIVVARKGTLDNPLYIKDDCWIIDTAFAVLPKNNNDAKWLYYNLSYFDLKKLNESTGVPSISRDYLYRVSFEKFSISEQQKIAQILSSVDAVIENTETTIEKYKAIKQGIMRNLFTRGIDIKTGKLRPRYEDAPELYRKTELGWVPKEWEVDTIENVSKRIWIGLVTTMTTHYVETGIPLIRNNNIMDSELDTSDIIYLDNLFSEQNKQRYLHKGDIVTVHTGDIGTSAIIESNLDPSHGFATINTTVNEKIIVNTYLCDYFNTQIFKHRIEAYATGDGRSNFNLYDYLYIKVPYSKIIDEQRAISEKLYSIRKLERKEVVYLNKLMKLKRALMSDLLTGRVPVEVEEKSETVNV